MAESGGQPNQAGGGGDSVGTLFVDIDARLDRFDEKMRQVEKSAPERFNRSMQETAESTREVGDAAEEAGVSLGSVATAMGSIIITTDQLRTSALIFKAIRRSVQAVGVAVSGVGQSLRAVINGPVVALFAIPTVIAQTVRLIRNIPDILERIRNIDISAVFTSLRDQAEEAVQSLGTSIGQLANNTTILRESFGRFASQISELFGRGNLIGDIDDANEGFERSEQRLTAMANAAEAVGDAISQAMRSQTEAEQQLSLMQAESPAEEARLRGQFNEQDIRHRGSDRIGGLRDRFGEATEELEGLRDEGDIGEDEFQTRMNVLQQRQEAAEQQIREATEAEVQAEREKTQERVEAALESEQQAARRREQQVESLQSELTEARLRGEDEQTEAQVEAIRRRFDRRISEAERQGHDQRMRLLKELRDERIEQVRDNARQEAEAEAEERRRQAQQQARERLEERQDVRTDLASARARGAGEDEVARALQMRERFEDDIAEAERNDRGGLSDDLRDLFGQRMQNLISDVTESEQSRSADFMEVGRARIAPGGPGAGGPEEETKRNTQQTVEMLRKIHKSLNSDRSQFSAS